MFLQKNRNFDVYTLYIHCAVCMCLWIRGDAGALRRCRGVKELLKGTYLVSLVPDQLSPVSKRHVDTVVDTHGQLSKYSTGLCQDLIEIGRDRIDEQPIAEHSVLRKVCA